MKNTGFVYTGGRFAPPSARPRGGAKALLSKIEKLCIDKGMKMTGQRRIIARVLSEAADHPDVEEVHRRAHTIDSRISIATVYRTVRLFEEAGIVEKHDFGDGRSRYEEVGEEHHDHLIDIQSGRVIEFQNAEIESLQEKIARQHGFKLVGHRLELFGVPLEGKDPPKDRGKR